jgi:hypothetical protein
MTVLDLITASVEELGIVAPGESCPAELATRGLARLNDWIDALALEPLTVTRIARTTWTLTTASSYTVGTGADVDVVRPVSATRIQSVGTVDTSTTPETEVVAPPLGETGYQRLTGKDATGTPRRWYYEPTLPTGTLRPYPISDGSGPETGVLYSEVPIGEFTGLTQTLTLPPGYRRFFRTNLALEVADLMDAQPSADLRRRAMESKAWVKRANIRPRDLSFGADVTSRVSDDIYTGLC